MAKKQTPLMEQYWGIKKDHTDKVLLFRMGDFFEMFHDDAVTAAPILNIALTQRNKKAEDQTPMCGVPHHSIAGPIAKLLDAGHKVAICDQVEDPKMAQGIVKRAVTRILSPGMVFDPETLEQDRANYICSFDKKSVSFLESTTGETFFYRCKTMAEIERIIHVVQPVEVVLSDELQKQQMAHAGNYHYTVYSGRRSILSKNLPTSALLLLEYARYMQGPEIDKTLQSFSERTMLEQWMLAPTAIRHLEIFENYRGGKEGSLFQTLNRTKTSSGARVLKNWLKFPLADASAIETRLDQVSRWVKDPARLKEVRKVFSGMGDIERRLGKISNPTCNPRDLLALADSLTSGTILTQMCQLKLDDTQAGYLIAEIEKTIEAEAPINFKKGGVIRKGYNSDLDQLIKYAEESQQLLVEMEQREKEATGIPSLKVRYNSVFGYYIEVTKTHTSKVPDHYKRKQTLTNAERYLTQELQELEEKILSARSKRIKVEEEMFAELRDKILKYTQSLLELAQSWARLDVYTSFAWLAIERNYCRPQLTTNGFLELKNCRHPVVEQTVNKNFVPNSLTLEQGHCLLLTGPNMAGKSTLMRQVAICSLLAQVGSFVPAQEAKLPLFKQIFTRIGASDFLSEGLSTFMVEMKETAEMLKSSDENTLVVLDEVGRGTSTFDGMSLAQAILEYLVTKSHSMVLFATHYHELTKLDRKFPQIHNAHMSIHEKKGDIEFLHSLEEGAANKSYGIQVAKLAGLPVQVTNKAQILLQKLESFGPSEGSQMSLLDNFEAVDDPNKVVVQPTKKDEPAHVIELLDQLKASSVQNMTPIEALNKIAEWQNLLN